MGGYRDEHEALRQRVAQLEGELAAAKSELVSRHGGEPPRSNPLLGGPGRLTIERTLPADLDEDTLARIVARLREAIGEVGRLERIGGSIAWSTSGRSGRLVEVTFERTETGTKLRITEPLQQLIGSLFGGMLGGIGGGGVIIPMSPTLFGHPEWLPFTITAWLGTVYLATRAVYKSRASKRHTSLQELADGLMVIAEEGDALPVRARVELSSEREAALEVDVDAVEVRGKERRSSHDAEV